MQLCGLNRRIVSWNEELEWATKKIKGKALLSIVLRLAWKASIYHIWRERNRRMHDSIPVAAEQIVEHVKDDVRIRLIGLKNISNDSVNSNICWNWGFSFA